jgi:hypothetical protein
MFETVEEKKETSSNRMWIGIALVAVLGAGGALLYTKSGGTAKSPAPAAAPATAAAKSDADPMRDLKVFRATMDKDHMGTTAVWSVVIENRSRVYTYSDIHYETSYIGADNKPLVVNQGTLAASIEPGDQKSAELRDTLYPTGTAWYKFRITGATPKTQ